MQPTPKQQEALLDLSDWPRSWAREESDRAVGAAIIAIFTPFLEHLVAQGLAINTLRRHKNNLYLLGDKVLGAMTQFPEDAPATVAEALDDLIQEDEGPWLHDASEAEQRTFDTTCGKLCRYRRKTAESAA